ncbi:TPA: OmpA family protein [Mannheimia haemolytica]
MKKLIFIASSVLAVSACSINNSSSLEYWKNYGSDELNISHLSDKQALAVFYRTSDFQGTALNVYINGDYQASLLEQSYSPIAVCASNQLISASYSNNKKFGNRTQGSNYILPVKEIAFFRANKDKAGNPIFERVEADIAQQEIKLLKGKATHTLSRVVSNKDCNSIVLSNTALSASALWDLDKYAYRDILPEGKKEIATFAELVKGNAQIDRIEVRGYTDPEASITYNQTLSQRRAETVRQALQEAGVTQKITVAGYGKTNLVVTNCSTVHKKYKKERAICNQPNRRVEITTYSK